MKGIATLIWRKNMMKGNPLRISVSTVARAVILWGFVVLVATFAPVAKAQQRVPNKPSTGVETTTRILVRSSARVDIRSDIFAPVTAIPFRQGQKFTQGDTLIKFDCARYDAERNAAKAAAQASNIEHQTKRRLLKFQAIGKDEVRLAAALSTKANAELKVHEVRATRCEYKSPFDGRIVDTFVNAHEFPPRDNPLLTIIDDGQLELQLVIPSRWLRWLENEMRFRFEIDETGRTYEGIIKRIGAEIDPVSQTIQVIALFAKRPQNVLAGMSGTAYFNTGS